MWRKRSVTGTGFARRWGPEKLNLQSSRLACCTSKFQASLLRPCLKRSPALKRKTLVVAGVQKPCDCANPVTFVIWRETKKTEAVLLVT